MSTAHHTALRYGGGLTSEEMEAPLDQLDAAIASVIATGSGVSTTLTAQADAGTSGPFNVASTAGILVGATVFFGDSGGTNESRIVATVPSGSTFTVTANLTFTYPVGKPVTLSPIEIVDARAGMASLGARIKSVDYGINIDRWYSGLGDAGPAFVSAIVEAEATGKPIVLPERVYPISTLMPLLLNSANLNQTYRLTGLGKGAILQPSGLTSGQYIFHANRDAAGAIVSEAFHRHPRVIFENVTVDGVNSTAASLIRSYKRSVVMRLVNLRFMLNGVQIDGYTDNCRVEQVYVDSSRTGGWAFQQLTNGDGLVVDQLFVTDSTGGGLSLTNCASADISGRTGGFDEFKQCQAISWRAGHIEPPALGAIAPFILIKGSQISIRDSFFETNPTMPVIRIDDDNAVSYRQKSDVFIDRATFIRLLVNATDVHGTAVHIKTFNSYSRLRFNNSHGQIFNIIPAGGGGRWIFENTGMVVTADDANIQAALTANPAALVSGNTELRRNRDNTTWELVGATHSNLRSLRSYTTAPSIDLALASSTFASNLAAGTYYYVCALITPDGQSPKSAEVSATPTLNQSVFLWSHFRMAPVVVRFWRGTSAGTYDRYVDIVSPVDSPEWYDTGTALAGTAWITAGVPTPPTVNSLYDGMNVFSGGRRQLYGTAAPTTTTFAFARGDIMWNTAPSASGTIGWVCVTAGSPGTWKTFGAISA